LVRIQIKYSNQRIMQMKTIPKQKIILLSFFSLMALLIFSSCGNETNTANTNQDSLKTENTTEKVANNEEMLTKGFQLLEANCFSCHSPDADMKNRVAPPMIAIKKHYITEETTKEEFVSALIDFVTSPSEEKSKMPGAIDKFGLMPKMEFSEEELRSIAEYIYETEIEAPDWFEKHYEEERKKYANTGEGKMSYKERGVKYAMATKSVLGKNLMGAIKSKGTEGALEFCNTRAYPLTDSMALASNTKIKRVSDKTRNPKNVANAMELEYIKLAKNALSKGEKPTPQVREIEGKMLVYVPITTNKMCMQCHGDKNTDISKKTLEKISELYPEDKAIGYKENELRGIWVIKMDKN